MPVTRSQTGAAERKKNNREAYMGVKHQVSDGAIKKTAKKSTEGSRGKKKPSTSGKRGRKSTAKKKEDEAGKDPEPAAGSPTQKPKSVKIAKNPMSESPWMPG
jgi:hypothetical protein